VYFATPKQMNWEDTDQRADLYVARVGGGFAQPAAPTPCDPLTEGSCGSSAASPPALGDFAASSVFQGQGNLSADRPVSCNRNQVRRGDRCVAKRALAKRACSKRKGKAKRRCVRKQVRRLNRIQARQQRATNKNGRAGK
jgi:hypothetical protein